MVTTLIVAISLQYMNVSNDYVVHLELIIDDSFVTPCTIAHQAALSMGFPRQEYCCHFLLQGIFPTQGSNPCLLRVSPALAGRFFTTASPGKPKATFSSVRFSRSVVSNSLQPHESQHARPPCPSPTPRVHSNSCP